MQRFSPFCKINIVCTLKIPTNTLQELLSCTHLTEKLSVECWTLYALNTCTVALLM